MALEIGLSQIIFLGKLPSFLPLTNLALFLKCVCVSYALGSIDSHPGLHLGGFFIETALMEMELQGLRRWDCMKRS